MTALPRLQQALVDARPRPRRAPRVLAAAGVVGAAAFAVASLSRDADPERVATPPVGVAVGRPVDPERAGDPPEGWIEMRATDPVSGEALAGLYFTYRGDPCWDVGRERVYRDYPVREGGSCRSGGTPTSFGYGVSSRPGHATLLTGSAGEDVVRLSIAGAAGRHDVPLARHGGWFVALPEGVEGAITITAHLRNGERETGQVRVPVDHGPTPTPDPLEKELDARPADVSEVAVTPAVGGPDTTFELAVPPGRRGVLYAVSIDGPAGRDCRDELGETLGVLAGERRGRIRPLPPHRQAPFVAVDEPGYDESLRTAPWCPGRYRVKVRRIERGEKGDGRTVARLSFEVRAP